MSKIKIVILEKDTLSVGDMDFSPFETLGDVFYYDTVKGDELKKAIEYADVVLLNKTKCDEEFFNACKNLKYIGVFATGYNNVNINLANERGVTVCNAPSYSTSSVAQLTMTFILELASNLKRYFNSTLSGDWIESKTFSYFPYKFSELEGKTLGIFGLGEIGEKVANLANAFNMRVLACTRTKKLVPNVTFVEREELFKESDFLTFHCPLTPQTENLVNERTLNLMKRTAFIVNTSRGGVIDEVALAKALSEERIAGACLDVLKTEPMSKDCPLFGVKNCYITPHIAWTTIEARKRLFKIVYENLVGFLSCEIKNSVNNK